MKQVFLALAAVSSIGFGPAVYALPAMSDANCATKAQGEQMICQTCTTTRCYNCEVIGTDQNGNYVV